MVLCIQSNGVAAAEDFFGPEEAELVGNRLGALVRAFYGVMGGEKEATFELVQIRGFAAESFLEADSSQTLMDLCVDRSDEMKMGFGDGFEEIAKFVGALMATTEDAVGLTAFEGFGENFELVEAPGELIAEGFTEATLIFDENIAAADCAIGDEFSGCAGGGGTEVGGKIANGEVDFVADCADDWNF